MHAARAPLIKPVDCAIFLCLCDKQSPRAIRSSPVSEARSRSAAVIFDRGLPAPPQPWPPSLPQILDASRNALIRLDVLLSMGTFSLAFGTAGAAFLGMNLPTGWEEHPQAFYIVAASCTCLSAGVFVGLYRSFRLHFDSDHSFGWEDMLGSPAAMAAAPQQQQAPLPQGRGGGGGAGTWNGGGGAGGGGGGGGGGGAGMSAAGGLVGGGAAGGAAAASMRSRQQGQQHQQQ